MQQCKYKKFNNTELFIFTFFYFSYNKRFDTQNMTIEVDDKSHKIKLHDTAGQEEFENLRKAFMKNKKPDVFILCYSVDNRRSFENITKKWIQEIRNRAPIVLVATKIDLRNTLDHVSNYEGKSLCQQIKAKAFVECSSLTLLNINEVFCEAIRAATSTDDIPWITKYCEIS